MRKPGYCATCSKPVREITQRTAQDYIVPRWPLAFGGLDDKEAEEVTLLLTNGRWTTITVCSRCAPSIDEPEMMRRAWTKQLELGAFMADNAQHIHPRGEYSPEERKKVDDELITQWKNPPIAIIGRRKLNAKA